MNKSMQTLLIVATTSVLLAACSTPPKVETPPAAAPVAQSAPTPMPAASPAPMVTIDPLDDPKSILAKRSIYFDFDKYDVKPEFAELNSAHAKYLVSHTARTVSIQGNTDSRGGREYNLALGQKRAEAELKVLAALGVPNSRMEAVSFGKEKPKASGNNEAAWAENRRDDIVYSGK
ncbi:peptidoglycan-associated lipoprotein [Oxalobacteraceae bacterium GrIS 1.18]